MGVAVTVAVEWRNDDARTTLLLLSLGSHKTFDQSSQYGWKGLDFNDTQEKINHGEGKTGSCAMFRKAFLFHSLLQ